MFFNCNIDFFTLFPASLTPLVLSCFLLRSLPQVSAAASLRSWSVSCVVDSAVGANVCMNGWMSVKALWTKALYKWGPFTIYCLLSFSSAQDAAWSTGLVQMTLYAIGCLASLPCLPCVKQGKSAPGGKASLVIGSRKIVSNLERNVLLFSRPFCRANSNRWQNGATQSNGAWHLVLHRKNRESIFFRVTIIFL